MTPELKQLLTEQVRPEILQQVFDLIEGKKLTAESFKNMAIECDNDEQMRHLVKLAKDAGILVVDITSTKEARYFSSYMRIDGSYSNFGYRYQEETHIHYTDFINQYK